MKLNCIKISFIIFVLIGMFSIYSHSEEKFSGRYEIPINDDKLKSYSVYDVLLESDFHPETNTNFSFQLPSVLIGEKKRIILKRINTSEVWKGDFAEGKCSSQDNKFQCTLRFTDLDIDHEKVINSIMTTYSDPAEQSGRIQAAKFFSTEPIGIITYSY